MYELFLQLLPRRFAVVALGAWYAMLILLILLFGATPETTIRYMNL